MVFLNVLKKKIEAKIKRRCNGHCVRRLKEPNNRYDNYNMAQILKEQIKEMKTYLKTYHKVSLCT